MKVWPVDYKLQILSSGGPARSGGLHVSEVIRDLALRGKILDAKYGNNSEMSAERIELGIAWEERLFHHFPRAAWHPGEIAVDDIAMSIDGIHFHDGEADLFTCDQEAALLEVKVTWKSSRKPIDEHWMWLTQIKSYLHGLTETSGIRMRTAFLQAMFMMGNYAKDFDDPESGPKFKIYGLEFTDLEIKENWQMIKNAAKRMQGAPTFRRVT